MKKPITGLVIFLIVLTLFGFLIATSFSPVNILVLGLFEIFSILSNAFLFIAIGTFLILIGCNRLISGTIVELTTYRLFDNIHEDKRSARFYNFFRIYGYNIIFGILLSIAVIFLISTVYPFENTTGFGKFSDFDFALITAILAIPGLLLSLRLLANPVEKKFPFPIMVLITLPVTEIMQAEKIKERAQSFYFAFIETSVVSMLILFLYQMLKVGDGSYKIYFDILKTVTPTLPYTTITLYLAGFLFSLLVTTTIGEILLEWGNPIIQE